MNVNGINPDEIRAQAQELLQNGEKIDLGKEDLALLWENAKLTQNSALFENISDEDAISQFDVFDNDGNTAETSYKLLMNWLKENSGLDFDIEPVITPVGTTETETPAADALATDEPAAEEPTTEEPPAEEQAEGEKQHYALNPDSSKEVTVGGKTYKIESASKTVNNIVYYVQNGQLIIEGSDIKVTSSADNEDKVDNVRVMGNRNTVDLGDGNDIIDIEGSMNMIYGGSGNDFIKMRGDYNTADMSDGSDMVWMDGIGNVGMGQGGDDNFFAIGEANTFFGQDDTDASYYDESRGVGHEFRVENKISADDSRVKDFNEWVNPPEPVGPPYRVLPDAPEGHEVRAYDDESYTDRYEEAPNIITDYKDIAYRELHVRTMENKVTGAGSVEFVGEEDSMKIEIASSGDVTITAADETEFEIPATAVKFIDKNGEEDTNPGTMEQLLIKLATRQIQIADIDTLFMNARYMAAGIPRDVIEQGIDAIRQYAEENNIELPA